MVPSGSMEALPSRVTESSGKVTAWFAPALATGGWFAAAITVIPTVAVDFAPLLSVTVNWKVYFPTASPDTVAVAVVPPLIVEADGPDNCVQLYPAMVPSGS